MTLRRLFDTRLVFTLASMLAVAGSLSGCSSGTAAKEVAKYSPDCPRPASRYPGGAFRKVVIPVTVDPAGNVTEILDPRSDDPSSHGDHAATSKKAGHRIKWIIHPDNLNVALLIAIKPGQPEPFKKDPKDIDCPDGETFCVSNFIDVSVNPTDDKRFFSKYNITIRNLNDGAPQPKMKDPAIRVDP